MVRCVWPILFLAKGRKEGKVQQIQEIVQKMLNKKMAEDIIQEVTGLKKEEIDKIKQETL